VSVKAPAERNFRRAKVKPGRRKAARRRFPWRALRFAGLLGVLLFGVYRCVDFAFTAPALRVNRIAVQGNVRLTTGEIEQLASGLHGTNILSVDLDAERRALLSSPWVADAALRRVLPSTIEISVLERVPVGISRLGGQLYLIDRTGTVIDEFGPQYAAFDLPIIDGLVEPPRDGQPSIDLERTALAVKLIDDLAAHPSLSRRVSQIDVTNRRDAVVLLDDDPALLHLGTERFLERLQSYIDVAATLRDRFPDIDYVDLRFENRVYVGPRASGGEGGLRVTTRSGL
jgi:cell division protein FtsQ